MKERCSKIAWLKTVQEGRQRGSESFLRQTRCCWLHRFCAGLWISHQHSLVICDSCVSQQFLLAKKKYYCFSSSAGMCSIAQWNQWELSPGCTEMDQALAGQKMTAENKRPLRKHLFQTCVNTFFLYDFLWAPNSPILAQISCFKDFSL